MTDTHVASEPEIISLIALADRFMEVHSTMKNRAFAFVLGAGASRSSGIKGAGEMVSDWVRLLHREAVYGAEGDGKAWATASTLRISKYDPANPAASYSELYRRMYKNDPDRGYAYLEEQMRSSEPSYGYSVLARIMEEHQHKVVVTTNFDNLVADSLSIFSTTYPLVCGHESLAGFISARVRRPIVVKVHRDLLLAPKSSPEELDNLPEEFTKALAELFRHYTPIVIGYGGNDGSLMKFLKGLEPGTVPGGVYWCYWEDGPAPSKEIQGFVAAQRGSLVPIPGFDETMMLLGNRLELPVPDKFLLDRAKTRADRIVQQAETLKEKLTPSASESTADTGVRASVPVPSGSTSTAGPTAKGTPVAETAAPDSKEARVGAELISAILSTMQRADGERRWWQWQTLAASESDPVKRDQTYRDALEALPTSAPLLGNYANFLTDVRKDHDAAEVMYKRALEADPKHADNLGNYAVFLKQVRKDHDAAEVMYKRALEADPKHANNLGNYAVFLTDVRKDHDAAEAMYKRALEADPKRANTLGNYAKLLFSVGRVQDGLQNLDLALRELHPSSQLALKAELWMYATCQWLPDRWRRALGQLKVTLVDQKVTTGDWDFSGVIETAKKRSHPGAAWLESLARVCAGTAAPSTLETWEAWTSAN